MEELREMSPPTDEEEREPAEERGEMCKSTRTGLNISTLGAKKAGVSTHVITLFLPSLPTTLSFPVWLHSLKQGDLIPDQ